MEGDLSWLHLVLLALTRLHVLMDEAVRTPYLPKGSLPVSVEVNYLGHQGPARLQIGHYDGHLLFADNDLAQQARGFPEQWKAVSRVGPPVYSDKIAHGCQCCSNPTCPALLLSCCIQMRVPRRSRSLAYRSLRPAEASFVLPAQLSGTPITLVLAALWAR